MKQAFIIVLYILIYMSSCVSQSPWQQDKGFVFGTLYNITYQSDRNLQQEIEAELQKVDMEFSMFNENSTVARINRGDTTVEHSEMFREVYELALAVNHDTEGAFDVTVAPLVNAWGFGTKNETTPSPQQVDSLLRIHSQLDFSAVAKGYGCDVVARLLKKNGINNFLVEIGGEVVASGQNTNQSDWRIGVNKPIDDSLSVNGQIQAVVSVSDKALATSGNYRNFYYKDGRKYAHTIDPRTGYPVQHNILSATVLAGQCAKADAYATSFMVLGLDGAKAVLARHQDLQAYLIYSNAEGQLEVWHSEGLTIE